MQTRDLPAAASFHGGLMQRAERDREGRHIRGRWPDGAPVDRESRRQRPWGGSLRAGPHPREYPRPISASRRRRRPRFRGRRPRGGRSRGRARGPRNGDTRVSPGPPARDSSRPRRHGEAWDETHHRPLGRGCASRTGRSHRRQRRPDDGPRLLARRVSGTPCDARGTPATESRLDRGATRDSHEWALDRPLPRRHRRHPSRRLSHLPGGCRRLHDSPTDERRVLAEDARDRELSRESSPSFMSRQELAGPMTYSEAQAARVRKELAGRPGLIEKQMFGGIAFLLGGNMAVGVHGEDLIVRVGPAQTDVLLHETGAKPFDLGPGGRSPAGWLLVAPSGFRTDAALHSWVARGVAYAASLPKKGTKPTAGSKRRARP